MKVIHVSDIKHQLQSLLQQDLDFRTDTRSHPLHGLHAYAARFPPPLPRLFIEGLTHPGETVLDPMAGSGVALVEGLLGGRSVIGIDIDPLAVRLCLVKATAFKAGEIKAAGLQVLECTHRLLGQGPLLGLRQTLDQSTVEFIDYWFKPETQKELAALVLAIRRQEDWKLRTLLEVVFSSIIVTKSGGVSLARDLAHSRPHRVEDKIPGSPLQRFESALYKASNAYASSAFDPVTIARVSRGDCRWLPLRDMSVDLIVTSPPYANALDYVRAHKFSLCWLGHPIKSLSVMRSRYIGSEKWANVADTGLPSDVYNIVKLMTERDSQKARVLHRYFLDMSLSIGEMHRVLRPGRAAVIIVGPSTMHGIFIPTHEHLASIGVKSGFELVGIAKRKLDRGRRMLPARARGNGQSVIEQRIHEEYVIGLVRP